MYVMGCSPASVGRSPPGVGVPVPMLFWGVSPLAPGDAVSLGSLCTVSLPDGPFCQATLDGIPTQAVAATACPGPPGAERATSGLGGTTPKCRRPRTRPGGDLAGPRAQPALACRVWLELPSASPPHPAGCTQSLGKAIPRLSALRPSFFPTLCYGMCQCLYIRHNPLTSSPLFLPFLLTDIKASPASLPRTEGLLRGVFSSQGFSRRDLLWGIPVACWSVGSPASAGHQGPV